ncbi:MAG: DNA mismatch repair endonuclease MutL [Clostridiales Family XIII bacterium]|jgi:DNA mismatch repair protein MutL|nr:DNA mismatch repair endonuclease MutL [Clostridiales Family XIII bacterium]
MKINKLPKEVYDLIAAGEVVLAPVSVVKELVENALDAGATRVTVETAAGGCEKIRVADNGSGVARDEIELAFAPHATSKLSSADDLSRIDTLGFRGEALASIAAVSSVVLVTKTASDLTATRAATESGSPPALAPCGADQGTDITVERLFFNIPARKKHLGAGSAEGRKITEYLSKAAVSRPDAAFRLIADGALVFATLGGGDRLAAIAAAYGSKTAEHLVRIDAVSPAQTGAAAGATEGSETRIEGWVAGPLGMRNNRKGQHFFVNGRPVANAAIEGAVARAYREFAEPGRFPIVFLFLTVDPGAVDVNVHPAKSEISFVDTAGVADFAENAIRETLQSKRAIPAIRPRGPYPADTTFRLETGEAERLGAGQDTACPERLGAEKGAGGGEPENKTIVSTSGGDGEKVDAVDINTLLSGAHEGFRYDPLVYDKKLPSSIFSEPAFAENPAGLSKKPDSAYPQTLDIAGLKALATLFATYILATDGDVFYIIDQHAAHERVNFERFRSSFSQSAVPMQALAMPHLFTPPASAGDLAKWIAFFAKLGYEIDEFGENTWAARTFPAFISHGEGAAFLAECLDALESESEHPETVSHEASERIMMRACKASVKANTALSDAEIAALLRDLADCGNPYTCPHGRPVFLQLTRSDIERLFKRS